MAGTLLALGVLRWLVTAGIYAAFDPQLSGLHLNPILLLCVGTMLLFWCAGWCAYLLNCLSVRSKVWYRVQERVERLCGEEVKRA